MSGAKCTPLNIYAPNHQKAQLKSILKKHPCKGGRRPQFFCGNESTSDNLEKAQLSSFSQPPPTETSQIEALDFDKSCLSQPCIEPKRIEFAQDLDDKPKKRHIVSHAYILHSIEINREIIKSLLRQTEALLEDFKLNLCCEYFTDRDLLLVHKEKLLEKLKDYLTGTNPSRGKNLTSKKIFELGATLSEPNILNIKQLRALNSKENLAHAKSSITMWNNNFDEEETTSGSLPDRSFMDLYSKEFETTNKETSFLDSFEPQVQRADLQVSVVEAAKASRKMVRFADSFGFDLEKVQIISNNSFMDMFSGSNYLGDEEDTSAQTVASVNPFVVLIPLFGLKKLDQSSPILIRLDSYVYDSENKIIRCMVRVKNMCFNKRVFARTTFNNWKTSFDLNAIYVKSESQLAIQPKNATESRPPDSNDFFAFCIIIPDRTSIANITDGINKQLTSADEFTLRIEFALCYVTSNNTYWDNNLGQNYKFQCFFNRNS